MAVEFKLPELGDGVDEAQVVSVLVQAGDTVDAEQEVIEVETDKAVTPVPIDSGGKISEIKVSEGDTVKPGQVLMTVEGDGEDAGDGKQEKADAKSQKAEKTDKAAEEKAESEAPAKDESQAKTEQPEAKEKSVTGTPWESAEVEKVGGDTAEAETPSDPEAAEAGPPSDRLPVAAAPSVRTFAREVGVDITQVAGSGPGGRITEADIKKHARTQGGGAGGAATPAATTALPDFSQQGPVERESLTMIARKTAEHMARCWATIPHVTLHEDIDVTDLEAYRQQQKGAFDKRGAKLTVTALLVKLLTVGLKQHPKLNASLDLQKQEMVLKRYYHIGVAADTPRGLVVPVIKDADQKSLLEIATELGEMAEKARSGKLALEDMQGATFTLTNLGGIGCGYFTPIVNYPEVGILGVGTAKSVVQLRDGELTERSIMPTSLSFDHRAVNGADGARFNAWLKTAIENPLGALLG